MQRTDQRGRAGRPDPSGRGGRREAGRAARRGPGRPGAPAVPDLAALWARWSWGTALTGLFALAWAWRTVYLERLAGTPLGDTLSQDAGTYWRWAGALRHIGILGHNAFFLGPLYPYVLALLRVLTGDSVPAVLRIQALWGALAVVLLADAARRLAGRFAGLAVGLALALYEMATFFDGLVLMESLLFFLEAWLLWWVVRCDWSTFRARAWLVLGLLVGLLAEGRATSALLLLPALATLTPLARGGWRPRLAGGAVLATGFLIVCLPVAVRTRAVTGEWIPFTYNLGYNLYVGNNPRADGTSYPITGTQETSTAAPTDSDGGVEADGREYLRKTEGVSLSPGASSAWWAAKATRYVREHPGHALALAATKCGMLWNRREYAQIENADEFRMVAGPLGLPLAGQFAGLGTLALAGVWLAWRNRGAARFLVGYVVVATLGTIPFFVTDRYRHHLVPAAALLAALAVQRLWQLARRRPGAQATRRTLFLALAAGLIVVNLPAPDLAKADYAWRVRADLGNKWLTKGRPDMALPELERALAIRSALGRGRQAPGGANVAELYYDFGRALAGVGRGAESLAWYERALREAPDDAVVIAALATEYRTAGRIADASRLEQRLPALVSGEGHALESRAWLAAHGGRLDEAERLFLQAVAVDPSLSNAWLAIVRLQLQRGRPAEARATLERARLQEIPPPLLHAHEALLAAAAGDRAAAERALVQVPQGSVTGDPVLADVLQTTRRLLDQRK
jgi:tetratricopeptide (TPR) repeat protein